MKSAIAKGLDEKIWEIKKNRKILGWSMEELAKRANVDYGVVADIEKNKFPQTLAWFNNINRLVAVLNAALYRNVEDFEILDKFIRKGRWFVRLQKGDTTRTMPQANYMWLKGNPGFKEIPKAYSVHHLDHDPLNDDLSNLALMYKHHHVAHHLKQKKAPIVPIRIDPQDLGSPIRRPRIYYHRNMDRWFISYTINELGKTVTKSKRNIDGRGKNFKTKEEAEKAIEKLWPHKPWEYPEYMATV